MTKEELIGELANRTGFTKVDILKVFNELIDIITEELSSGGYVKIVGFGVFRTRTAAPRVARDVDAGKRFVIPERVVPIFEPGKGLKDACDNTR